MTETSSDEGFTYTRRQQKVIDAAEKVVNDARRDVEAAEDVLREARNGLRSAQRELHRLYDMGDCL